MICSKKGSILDSLSLILMAFVFVILIIGVGIAQKKTGEALDSAIPSLNDSVPGFEENADIFVKNTEKYSSFWDFLILFVIFGIWFIMFISSWNLGNSPLFLVLYVVISICILITGFVLWVAGDEIFTSPSMEDFTVDYPMVTYFMTKLYFIWSVFFVITIGLALYLKPGGKG